MSTHTTSLRRVVTFISGVAVGLFLLTGVASATPPDHSQDTSPQPASKADYSGNGANHHGSYDSTRDGSPSGNGNGGGEAKGKPCAGCVGKADNKNPKGQAPDGSDHNRGYECDTNHGIGRTNPAHTGCRTGANPSVGGTTDDTNTGPSASDTPSSNGGSVGSTNDNASKPACTGDMASATSSACTPASSDEAGAAAEVKGASLVRAAAVSVTLADLASRGESPAAAVSGAEAVRGLAFTGSGVDLLALSLVGVALLTAGLVLVRRARTA
jgi:hypothetical protein